MKRFAVAVAIAVSLVVVRPADAAVTRSERRVENSIFAMINNQRTGGGLGAEHLHTFARRLAEGHSAAMARRGVLGHFGFTRRVNRLRANDSGINGFVCENVAYVSGSSITRTQAASMIFNGWMNSPPHRKCMLDQEGGTTQSAAVGIKHAGNTWWATYIAAHDTSP